MRTLTLSVTLVTLVSQGGVAFAQQSTQGAVAEATPIEKVLEANPEPDGKAYRIDLLLSEGTGWLTRSRVRGCKDGRWTE